MNTLVTNAMIKLDNLIDIYPAKLAVNIYSNSFGHTTILKINFKSVENTLLGLLQSSIHA